MDLMKTLPPLLGTEEMEENCLTHNFRNPLEQQKKNIWIKAHRLKLTQNLYTLVVMKDLMKTQSALARKTAFTLRNLSSCRKLVNTKFQ